MGRVWATAGVVLLTVAVAAFVVFGYPGYLREPDDAAARGVSAYTAPAAGQVQTPRRPVPLADPVTCAFTPDPAGRAPKKATPPPDGPAPSSGTVPVRLDTSAGAIGLTLDRALAPCTVVNFLSLAKQGFYDGTACHRLAVAPGLRMLQCGDPAGDGTGGPGYRIKDETFPQLRYGRGILAMATTSEPDSGGSQFFMVFGEAELPPAYTVFGTIDDAGLAVLDRVAAAGVDPAKVDSADGTGPPEVPVKFTKVTTP